MFKISKETYNVFFIVLFLVELIFFVYCLRMAINKGEKIIKPIKNLADEEDNNQTFNVLSLI